MTIIDIIRSRKPKPHAREGILLCRRWKEAQAGLLFDRHMAEMARGIERVMEPLDDPQFDDLSVTDKQRLREAGF